jgi:hypothetical protein
MVDSSGMSTADRAEDDNTELHCFHQEEQLWMPFDRS